MPSRSRVAQACGAALLVVAVLAGCGGSDPTKPGPGADTPQAAPAASGSPTPSAAATSAAAPSTSATSTATTRPEPTRASRPTSSSPPVNAARVQLGKDFRLEEGRSARVEGSDLFITFTRLVSDSRCPTNVTCIQAGEATVAITVVAVGGSRSFELSTPGNAGSNEERFGKFLIQLQAVEPYPTDPAGGAKSDVPMVAVLRVVKQG